MAGTVREHLDKYYTCKGCNCAETTFLAANDAWELNMPVECAKMLGGFGGGMAIKGICGAISGGAAALSCYYVRESGHNSPLLMAKVKMFRELVLERLGNDNCSAIGPQHQTKAEGCLPAIRRIAEILDEVKNTEIDKPAYVPRRVKNAVLDKLLGEEHIVIDIRTAAEKSDKPMENAIDLPENLDALEKYRGINIILCGTDLKKAGEIAEAFKIKGFGNLYLTETII